MDMKRSLYVLAMLMMTAVTAGSVMAQANPFVGTWKLNVAKSKFAGAPAPKSLTRTVTADGVGLKYSFDGVAADGSNLSYSFTSNLDGKDSAVTGTGMPGGADRVMLKKVSATKTERVTRKGGKEVAKHRVKYQRMKRPPR
jgi:hypothetical protein